MLPHAETKQVSPVWDLASRALQKKKFDQILVAFEILQDIMAHSKSHVVTKGVVENLSCQCFDSSVFPLWAKTRKVFLKLEQQVGEMHQVVALWFATSWIEPLVANSMLVNGCLQFIDEVKRLI